MTDAKQVLRDAAEYLAEHGWTQDKMYDYSHAHNPQHPSACAMGAIEQVSDESSLARAEAQGRMANYLKAKGLIVDQESYIHFVNGSPLGEGIMKHPLAWWNDMPTTTAEDVILALKDAANE